MKGLYLMLLLLMLPLAACSSNALEGSIGESLSLEFNQVKIKKQGDYLVAEYLRESVRGTEKICKLSIDTQGLDLPGGGSFEIGKDLFLSHVELQRITFDNDEFPAVEKGRMRFEFIDFQDGGSVESDFLVVFVDSNTLRGLFIGSIQEI